VGGLGVTQRHVDKILGLAEIPFFPRGLRQRIVARGLMAMVSGDIAEIGWHESIRSPGLPGKRWRGPSLHFVASSAKNRTSKSLPLPSNGAYWQPNAFFVNWGILRTEVRNSRLIRRSAEADAAYGAKPVDAEMGGKRRWAGFLDSLALVPPPTGSFPPLRPPAQAKPGQVAQLDGPNKGIGGNSELVIENGALIHRFSSLIRFQPSMALCASRAMSSCRWRSR
jgi:hypothetical protein